jgi:hypothetical protein
MTAVLSIFFKWQKMWNKGDHNFNFISEWGGTAPQAPQLRACHAVKALRVKSEAQSGVAECLLSDLAFFLKFFLISFFSPFFIS